MMRGKVAANEWWVRGECYGFELHFPLGTFPLPIPLSFVPLTTLIGYRWACLRTKYTDYPIKPLNCPWLSYPFVISYSLYCSFSMVGARPHSL